MMTSAKAGVRLRMQSLVVSACVALSGCTGIDGLADGIAPVLDGPTVQKASSNRSLVLDALRQDAGYGSHSASWYDVTVSGFNYVDDACSQYFDHLFKLNRKRDAARSALSVTGQTSNAILFAAGATQLSMSIVAQAFGLTSSLTDIVTGTYLYQLPPATTKSFVAKLALAYREGAAAKSVEIASPSVAYGYIRGYLDLCLPATIEGALVEHVGSAKAVPVPSGAASGVSIRVASDNAPEVAAALTEPQRVTDPLPPVATIVKPKRLSDLISSQRLARIQKALCVKDDGTPGPGSDAAIKQFFLGRDQLRPDIDETGITATELNLLMDAVTLADNKTCAERDRLDAFDVGKRSL
jgi:hypothetical protein